MAGRRNAGMGRRERGPEEEKPSTLSSEEGRLTSLLGGNAGGELSDTMGVAEPACETATKPLAVVYTAELGREGVRLDSREVDTLLDRRRSQAVGRAFNILDCSAPSVCGREYRSIATLGTALGVRLLCLFCAAFLLLLPLILLRVPGRPWSPSLAMRLDRVASGAKEASKDLV